MKTLFVLRHAKSSWDHPELSDFERPLNRRGEKAAPRIGAEMAVRGYNPAIIISSPAVRAKQTTALVADAAGLESQIVYNRSIYGSGVSALVYIVSEIPDDFDSAMIVGHNPGFEHLVAALSGESHRMPTAALAVIDFDASSWTEIESGSGKLVDFLVPKQLV